jgi:hypothetical protein
VECPSADEIVAYVGAGLSPERRTALTEHAADCPACRVALSDLARAHAPTERGPSSVARYQIRERVGRGAMGTVYRAHDPQLDREVAVKLLDQPISGGGEWLSREGRALAHVSDAAVVTVFDAGLHEGRPFVVMEYVAGSSLARWLVQSPRPWREVLQRFLDAGRGLAAVHAAGIVHGDFKPDNILVGHDGRVRVTDFGLAHWTAARTAPLDGAVSVSDGSVAGGTPVYMAPEQLLGERGDALSDQFSFGVALYEGLCGRRPFDGNSLDALRTAMTRPPPPPPPTVPHWLGQILRRALAPERGARFPSVATLLEYVEARLLRRRRLALMVGVAALLVGLGVLIRNELPQPDRSCRIEARRLATLWHPDQLAPAVRTTAAFAALDQAMRRYLADWVTARVGACEDASATDPADRARFTRRMACLDARRHELMSLTPGLATAGAEATLTRLEALSRPQACILK